METFNWIEYCEHTFAILKEKMVNAPILTFLNYLKEFHVYVDLLVIAFGFLLAQPRKGEINHPIYFANNKLSQVERNYTTIEREGLVMIYALQKLCHYFLGGHFKSFHGSFTSQVSCE